MIHIGQGYVEAAEAEAAAGVVLTRHERAKSALAAMGFPVLSAVGLCRLNHVDPCHITYSLSNPQPIAYQVKNRFQSLPFKCNLQRYSAVGDV